MRKPYICFFGTYDRNFTSNKLILDGLKALDIPVLEVNYEIKVTRLDKKEDLSWVKLLKRIVVKYGIIRAIIKNWKNIKKTDAIYVGYPGHFDVLIAWPVAKLLQKKLVFNPLVVFYTGFTEEQGILKKESLMGRVSKFGESLVYNLCDIVFADTPLQETFLTSVLNVKKEKIRVLPIGADDKYYHYTPYTNLSKKINVTYYGLYSPIHGVDHIIKAANLLKNDHDIEFVFVGNGQTFERNYQLAQKLELKNCTFYFDTPLDQHPAIIAKADIFFGFLEKHPSVDRIIPNKIYQGMALNKVVFTADAPVVRSLFAHKENMYFCNPADPKALAQSLTELKDNPQLRKRIAENGYALFKKEFTPSQVCKKLIKYVNEIK